MPADVAAQIFWLKNRRPEYECLYGGAAGGGKSDALIAEALRQVDVPNYRGLILRRTFPQLEALISR
ncbi:MAG: hypothetical protein J6V07_05605, partial [Clostridia bacterium]|nr:hypothetical protein [Clostridia bacterium]